LSIATLPQITHGCAVKELYDIRTPVIFDNLPDNALFFDENSNNALVIIKEIGCFETRSSATVLIFAVILTQGKDEIEFIIKADSEFIEELITSKKIAIIHTSRTSIENEITIGCEIDSPYIKHLQHSWGMATRTKAMNV